MVLAWTVRRTIYGRYLLSAGGNERAAIMAGVPVARVKIATYVIAAVLAGLAGLIVVADQFGLGRRADRSVDELDAIAAAVVGGAALAGGRGADPWDAAGRRLHSVDGLYADRQRHLGRDDADRDGGDHRRGRLAATRAEGVMKKLFWGWPCRRLGRAGPADRLWRAALRQFRLGL